MLTAYHLDQQRLTEAPSAEPLSQRVAWIDLNEPTTAEERQVEALMGIGIPTREEMAEIEVSSRLYSERGTLYMTASVIVGGDGPSPQTTPVTFIVGDGRLVTVRYAEPGAFRIFRKQAERPDSRFADADAVFVALIEAIIDRTADVLESVSQKVDGLSRDVFQKEAAANAMTRDYKAMLRQLGRNGDLTSKVRESLVSLGRLVNFLAAECKAAHSDLAERTNTMLADIKSLTDHATYVSGTTAFLLDAMLGLINIEQNAIIKIVSVVSVLIMPPTLVATVYGMNFDFMPEIHWRLGYPLALAAMVLSGLLPYLYFKRRGWL
jgi:magnesium transporter